MFCKKCGASCEDGLEKCPACGAELDQAAPEAATDAAASNAAADASKAAASALKGLKGVAGKRTPLVIGAAVAVVAIIVVVAMSVFGGGGEVVSVDQVKKDIMPFIEDGFVSQQYTKEASYKISDLEIDSVEKVKNAAGVADFASIAFSGTISNGNFESTFTGCAGYYIGDKESGPSFAGEPSFDPVETKPLAGVSKFSFDDGSGEAKISDFSSTFDEKDGAYTSVATQTATQSFWFADDVATGTQKFTFDQEDGWEREGDVEISKQETAWKIADKTFSANISKDDMDPSGSLTGSIVLGELGDDGAVSAQYAMSFVPEAYDSLSTYSNVDLSGTATGHVVHEFGAEDFTIELNDPTNQVTLTCEDGEETSKAGVGDIPTMDVSIATETVYKAWHDWTDVFVASDLRYLLDSSAAPAPAEDQDKSAEGQDESAKDQDAPAEDQDAPAEE